MKHLLLSLFFVTLFYSVQAQEGFLIYTLQGTVSVKDNAVDGKARIGQLLTERAELNLSSGSAVSLICAESHLITISKAGKYVLKNFNKECADTKPSVTNNYLKYIWSQLTQKPGTPEKNRKQYMNNVGAVSRSINSIWIDPRLDTLNYTSGSFPLSWKSYADEEQFEFLLYTKKDIQVPILVIPTKSKHVAIDDLLKKMKPGEQYYWTAIVKGGTNDERKILNYVSKEAYKSFLKDLDKLNAVPEDEAAKCFRLGFLLEQAHYLSQAFDYYKKAAALQPGIAIYGTTLEAFKKDYGLQ